MIAGFISTDSFLQNIAPGFCLPFNLIGARHPGTGTLADSPFASNRLGVHFSFGFWSAGSSTTHDACRGCVVDFVSGLIAGTGYAQGTWLQQ